MPNPDIIFHISQSILSSISWRGVYSFLKFFFIFIDAILLVSIILVLHRTMVFRPPFHYPTRKGRRPATSAKDEAAEKWEGITEKSEESPPHSLTLAVIEADSFANTMLQKLGWSGETMADRLSHLNSGEVRSLQGVWEAHKARNEIVHSPGAEIEEATARRYLQNYENFLKEIGAL